MTEDDVKARLHGQLGALREAVLGKLDGLGEYEVRRPLTLTGTSLLGLVKHLALWESRYLGEVFARPFPEDLPRWDDAEAHGADLWVTAHETREEITGRYRRVARHADATISALPLDAPGHVPWWPSPDVVLSGVLVHLLTETGRHAGHADILREQLDGATGTTASHLPSPQEAAGRQERYERIERAAAALKSGQRQGG